jgi:hypothetical protein
MKGLWEIKSQLPKPPFNNRQCQFRAPEVTIPWYRDSLFIIQRVSIQGSGGHFLHSRSRDAHRVVHSAEIPASSELRGCLFRPQGRPLRRQMVSMPQTPDCLHPARTCCRLLHCTPFRERPQRKIKRSYRYLFRYTTHAKKHPFSSKTMDTQLHGEIIVRHKIRQLRGLLKRVSGISFHGRRRTCRPHALIHILCRLV